MRNIYVVFSGLIAACLVGCVPHLTQQQCISTNWHQVGLNDGIAGQQPRNLQSAIQDCAKFKLTVNQSAYHQGWVAGVKQYCSPTFAMGANDGASGKTMSGILGRRPLCQEAGVVLKTAAYKRGLLSGLHKYCTYDQGFNIGSQGNAAPNVCPGSLNHKFMQGWRAGSRKLCRDVGGAFVLGKQGKAYPQACNSPMYAAYRSEYNRGQDIYQKIEALNAQISGVDNRINDICTRWHIHQDPVDGSYYLGHHRRSPRAWGALHRVRSLDSFKQGLKDKRFMLQSTN